MKIAIIGSNVFTIPLEDNRIHAPLLLTWNLANKLSSFGHDVTYFGFVDTQLANKNENLKIVQPEAYEERDKLKNPATNDNLLFLTRIVFQQGYAANIMMDLHKYDIVYSWFASYVGPIASMSHKPVVITHHDSTNMDKYNVIFKGFDSKNVFMIPISRYMEKTISYPNMLEVVHHGVDENIISANTPDDYFCWIGRVAPSKGLHVAIKAAIKTKIKLKIIGPMLEALSDFGEVARYISNIKQMIKENPNIEYLGIYPQEKVYPFVSQAKALIFPTDGMESFSMVCAESVMAGTPVIATGKGPIPEIIKPGVNGYLVEDENNIDGFVNYIKKIDKIDRKKCREDAIERFSIEKMAKGYEKQFEIAIQKWRKHAKN